MMRRKSIKSETTHNGTLKTPVVFFSSKVASGLHNRDVEDVNEYRAWAELYSPSMKDLQILTDRDVKMAVTIKIRNPQGGYFPDNKHRVRIHHPMYAGIAWTIEDIRPSDDYITILLNGDGDGA